MITTMAPVTRTVIDEELVVRSPATVPNRSPQSPATGFKMARRPAASPATMLTSPCTIPTVISVPVGGNSFSQPQPGKRERVLRTGHCR